MARGLDLADGFAVAAASRLPQRARHAADRMPPWLIGRAGFRGTGARCGWVRMRECEHVQQAKAIADSRLYENKRRRRGPGEASVVGELA